MADPKKKATKTLRKPTGGRAYSGFGGVGLDQLYRISGLSYPFNAGRWASAGPPGGGANAGWGSAPGFGGGGFPGGGGEAMSAQNWADPGAMAGVSAAPLRGLAPPTGEAPSVANVPQPYLPPPPAYASTPSPTPAPSYQPLYPGQQITPGTGVMVGGSGGVAPHPISLGGGTNPYASQVFATTPVKAAPKPVNPYGSVGGSAYTYTAPKPVPPPPLAKKTAPGVS